MQQIYLINPPQFFEGAFAPRHFGYEQNRDGVNIITTLKEKMPKLDIAFVNDSFDARMVATIFAPKTTQTMIFNSKNSLDNQFEDEEDTEFINRIKEGLDTLIRANPNAQNMALVPDPNWMKIAVSLFSDAKPRLCADIAPGTAFQTKAAADNYYILKVIKKIASYENTNDTSAANLYEPHHTFLQNENFWKRSRNRGR